MASYLALIVILALLLMTYMSTSMACTYSREKCTCVFSGMQKMLVFLGIAKSMMLQKCEQSNDTSCKFICLTCYLLTLKVLVTTIDALGHF